ncbi:MaoC/PaaZ C-terminal domain-containing protein [Streptosporangium sp. NPDC002607]
MPVDLTAVGYRSAPHQVTWNADQAMLYALGVGAGAQDPLDELPFTTENSEGLPQRALPTFAVILSMIPLGRSYGDFDPARLLHAEQGIRLYRPLPVAGEGLVTAGIDAMYDKGSGALVTVSSRLTDAHGEPIADVTRGAFLRGEGGFGGERGPADTWQVPDREPDAVVEERTAPNQALLYRLSGDRNPLHSDPKFAAAGGFDRPILHGLCTYGFAGRALLRGACESEPARLTEMSCRFSRPTYPGGTLRTSIWIDGEQVWFRTADGDGAIVLDRGRARIGAPS